MNVKILRCAHCGNIAMMLEDKGVPMMCCGQKMDVVEAGVTEAATEKHIPVVTVENGIAHVVVGEVAHPMTEAHLIQWILLETNKTIHIRHLTAADAPAADFALTEGEEVVRTLAYCNLHSLWAK